MTAMIEISLSVAVVGWLLSLAWYRVTQNATPDKDTALLFAKIWISIGAFGIVIFAIIKHS
jgi:hypothetical protein